MGGVSEGEAGRPWRSILTIGFVTFHVFAITVGSMPAVRGFLGEKTWREPTVQHELRQWADALAQVGVSTTPTSLAQLGQTLGGLYSDVRDTLVGPFVPYYRYVGTGQAWNLFTSAHRLPCVLEIDLEHDEMPGSNFPLYRSRSAEHRWLATELDDVRLRKAVYLMGWSRWRKSYESFVQFLARRAAVEFPAASALRVRLLRYETPAPSAVVQGLAIEKTVELERRVPLGPLRRGQRQFSSDATMPEGEAK